MFFKFYSDQKKVFDLNRMEFYSPYFSVRYQDENNEYDGQTISYQDIIDTQENKFFFTLIFHSTYSLQKQMSLINNLFYFYFKINKIQIMSKAEISSYTLSFPKENFNEFYDHYKELVSQTDSYEYKIIVFNNKEELTENLNLIKKEMNTIKQKVKKIEKIKFIIGKILGEKCIFFFTGVMNKNFLKKKQVTKFHSLKQEVFKIIDGKENKICLTGEVHGRPVIIIPLQKSKLEPKNRSFVFNMYHKLGMPLIIEKFGLQKATEIFLEFLAKTFFSI
jgi:hypothetical protein